MTRTRTRSTELRMRARPSLLRGKSIHSASERITKVAMRVPTRPVPFYLLHLLHHRLRRQQVADLIENCSPRPSGADTHSARGVWNRSSAPQMAASVPYVVCPLRETCR